MEEALKQSVQKALAANRQLQEEFGEYPAVFNSKNMLVEINDLLKNKSFEMARSEIRNRPELNVGLLASKSLDLDYDPRLVDYGNKLHSVWSKIAPVNFRLLKRKKSWLIYFLRHMALQNLKFQVTYRG